VKPFPLISAVMYFAAAIWFAVPPWSADTSLMRVALAIVCATSGIALCIGKHFPLRLMIAGLFLWALLSLFAFAGFDQYGPSLRRRAALSIVDFAAAFTYLYFYRRFGAMSRGGNADS
jgi:hypothetical protein